ncbi:MAG: ATP-binding cassette domain-containing protein [Eubacteriales bacterium]|nr:ATP-binding cassette domain-containing protein [Eubacteriales bacterium]
METVLRTVGLTKRFGRARAVDHVSMTVNKGDIYGFIGKNGAGKTTFMRVVLGLSAPTEGTVELFGGLSPEEAGKKIGALIEAPGIFPHCTAKENMKRFAILKDEDESKIDGLLDFVGLGDVGNKKAGKFSLGMKQRLGIAIAMLGDPELLILDEPVNGLDPTGMKEIRDLILRLNREKGITVLISSHLLDELSKIVTRYGIINNGVLVDEIDASEMKAKTGHRLIIVVDDVEKAVSLLEKEVGKDSIGINGHAIGLSSGLDRTAELNALLVKNGVAVSSLSLKTDGLEKYFIEKVGG